MPKKESNILISQPLSLFMQLAKLQAIISRRFDNSLGGISLSEFIILYHIQKAPEQKIRRVDLAEKIGLTASGVTRMLLPMEKIHLIKRQANPGDARVSLVAITAAGLEKLREAIEQAESMLGGMLKKSDPKNIQQIKTAVAELLNNA
jgi:DNA-binding MarR family transcriptional regulator